MRAQLSLEFLIYSAIMLTALVIALAFYLKANTLVGSFSSNAQLEGFVGLINQNMVYQSSSFIAYVPKQLCNATVSNYSISFGNLTFGLNGPLSIQNSDVCALSGTFARLSMQQAVNGTFILG